MNQEEIWLLNEKYSGIESEDFFTDCARLKAGEPLAYIINSIPFRGVVIHLDSHPLIPRTETEYWVGEIITLIKERQRGDDFSVLDLCAGSGCIGVAVLNEIENARVDFAELDVAHHDTIRKNILLNGIEAERAKIIGGDLFEHVSETYDYILTNPPYIDATLNRTEKSVSTFEPHLALYGGEYGMKLIEKIIEEGCNYLNQGGFICIEHEPEQVSRIAELGDTMYTIQTLPDQYSIPRYTILTRKENGSMPE